MSDAVVEMREWGLVCLDELQRIVVVSPHLDDAVLGCGRLLARHPGATVVTLFAGGPAEYSQAPTRWDELAGFKAGDDVLEMRREEDQRALGELGAAPVWLDFVEHQYLERPDWVTAPATVDVLEAAIRAARPTGRSTQSWKRRSSTGGSSLHLTDGKRCPRFEANRPRPWPSVVRALVRLPSRVPMATSENIR